MPIENIPIADGVDGLFIKNDRFNTSLVSFNFYLPLTNATVSENALLPFVLSTCSEDYKTPVLLNRRLCSIYGATLSVSVLKCKNCQQIRFAVSVINDEFSLDNSSILNEAVEFLINLLFRPKVKNGAFYESDVQREKRIMCERILSEINDKRSYAKTQLVSQMFKNHPYGIPKYGSVEGVKAVTEKGLYEAYLRLIHNAYIKINVSAKTEPTEVFNLLKSAFNDVERENITGILNIEDYIPSGKVQKIHEKMDVVQGKVVMGYSSKLRGGFIKTAPLTVMCDLFGGGTYSKLFRIVREKLGLCYYCSVSGRGEMGFVMVDSGIEPENEQMLINEVNNQLLAIQNGDFSEDDLNSSKLSICDSLKSYYDSQSALDIWYSTRLSDSGKSPMDMADAIKAVTKEQVISAAEGLTLCSVFSLLPEEKDYE